MTAGVSLEASSLAKAGTVHLASPQLPLCSAYLVSVGLAPAVRGYVQEWAQRAEGKAGIVVLMWTYLALGQS